MSLSKLCADLVTQGHLEDTLCNAAVRNAPYGNSLLVMMSFFNGAEYFLTLSNIGRPFSSYFGAM
ncbi:MAG: hypothetical protein ACLSG5_04935 [Oscillospiraceae bacterium]